MPASRPRVMRRSLVPDIANIYTFGRCLASHRVPGQVVIQITDACNARCPQCGMRVTAGFARHRLSVDRVRRILDAAAARGVASVSFTGGEPFLMTDDLVAMIDHASRVGIPLIRTGTNGFWLRDRGDGAFENRVHRLAERLADTALRNLWISIDSADVATHERMRGLTGVIRGIEKALPIFQRHGIYPSANLGLNRNLGGPAFADWQQRQAHRADQPDYLEALARGYHQALHRFYAFVESLGFTIVNTCYPMSVPRGPSADGLSAVYAATAADAVVRYRRAEKAVLFRVLADVIAQWRHRLRIFTPLSALHHLEAQYRNGHPAGYGCRGGIDFFFIDAADGRTYPCGYRGAESLGSFTAQACRTPDQACRRCDWECFRDPSELFGPLQELRRDPFGLIKNWRADSAFYRRWCQDLRYYDACDWFDGRRPPDFRRLARSNGQHPPLRP